MEELIVRYLRLRPRNAAADPQTPDWAAITCTPQPSGGEEYHLCWMADDGRCLGWEDFASLQAALDWANSAAGIRPGEWRECRAPVESEDGAVPWSVLGAALEKSEP